MITATSAVPGGAFVLWTVLLSLASMAITLTATLAFLVRLPADFLMRSRFQYPKSLTGRLRRFGIHAIGWVLIALGIVLSIPGIPGQGLLTVLMGMLLVDFPGKDRLLQKLISRPSIRRSVDRIRFRFGRPPLRWEERSFPGGDTPSSLRRPSTEGSLGTPKDRERHPVPEREGL